MWWLLAFGSALLLGGYDSCKKISLKDNAVVIVLLLNTVLSATIFSPWLFKTGFTGWHVQKYIICKSVLVLLGALFLFGERLNPLQWTGVLLAMVAYMLMRLTGKSEGYQRGNKWILCLILAVILGAASGLYDKYLMSPSHLGLDRMQVLSWYSLYQALLMVIATLLFWRPNRENTIPFHWNWCIPFISIFLCGAVSSI